MKANSGKTYLGVGAANKDKAGSLNSQMVNHEPIGSIRNPWGKNNWGRLENSANSGVSQGRESFKNFNRKSYDYDDEANLIPGWDDNRPIRPWRPRPRFHWRSGKSGSRHFG